MTGVSKDDTIILTKIQTGDVINNGAYDILLLEDPYYNDVICRWMAKGRRWLVTRKVWQSKVEKYGWTVACAPRIWKP